MEADANFLHQFFCLFAFFFNFTTHNKRQRPAVWVLLRIETPTLFSSHIPGLFYSLVFHSFHFSATMLLDQNIIWPLRLARRRGREKESFALHTAEGCRSAQPRKWHQLKVACDGRDFFIHPFFHFFFLSPPAAHKGKRQSEERSRAHKRWLAGADGGYVLIWIAQVRMLSSCRWHDERLSNWKDGRTDGRASRRRGTMSGSESTGSEDGKRSDAGRVSEHSSQWVKDSVSSRLNRQCAS